MIALLILLGCPKPTPPTIYPDAFPQLARVELVEVHDQDDGCERSAAYTPGLAPPFVLDGLVTCRGTVVKESTVLRCRDYKQSMNEWYEAARVCYDGRTLDRAHGQQTVNRMHATQIDLERDNRALRYAGPVLFVSGVIVGAAIGVAASQVDQAILP